MNLYTYVKYWKHNWDASPQKPKNTKKLTAAAILGVPANFRFRIVCLPVPKIRIHRTVRLPVGVRVDLGFLHLGA